MRHREYILYHRLRIGAKPNSKRIACRIDRDSYPNIIGTISLALAGTQTGGISGKENKEIMKKTVLILLFLTAWSGTQNVFAQYEKTIGLGLHAGYGSHLKNIGGGVHLHYYYTNEIRLAPSFTYFLEKKGNKLWTIDADAHVVVPLNWEISLYPIGGLNYWCHASHIANTTDTPAEYRIKHRAGANLGLGLQYDIRYRIRINVEYKYQFIRNASQSFFKAGIGFWI